MPHHSSTSSSSSWTYLLLVFLTLAHLPFLKADADYDLSWSRGPWTDEGLHTCQVRNFIQHNDHSLDKSDNLIKTPLFAALLYGSYKVFGISLTVSRLLVVLLSIFLLYLIAQVSPYTQLWIILSIPLTFFQYYIFHYTHLALTEILSSICILIGVVSFYRALLQEQHRLRYNLLSAVCLAMSYYLKIQYAYIVVLVPLYLFITIVYSYVVEKKWNIGLIKISAWHTGTQALLASLYVVAWYLPNKTLYDYILADQTGDRYVSWKELGPLLDFYYHDIFLHAHLKPFTYLFFLSVVIGFLLLFIKGASTHFKILFFLFMLWIVLELHKLPMNYLPSRYLISAYLAMGSLITLVLRECLLRFFEKNVVLKLLLPLSLLPVLVVVLINLNLYKDAYQRREFSITNISHDLQNIDLENRPIVGPWAPALSWELNGYSFPVWYNYFNDKDLIKKHHPKVIISELQEDDSGMAFKNHQLHIDSLAQEIKYYKAAKWEIKVIILK